MGFIDRIAFWRNSNDFFDLGIKAAAAEPVVSNELEEPSIDNWPNESNLAFSLPSISNSIVELEEPSLFGSAISRRFPLAVF